MTADAAALKAWCEDALAAADARRDQDPETNPVKALAVALSQRLEAGDISTDAVDALIAELGVDAAAARAERLAGYAGARDPKVIEAAADAVMAVCPPGWREARAYLERPRAGIVFTAHPTFAAHPDSYAAIAKIASETTKAGRAAGVKALRAAPLSPPPAITLGQEHARVRLAIAEAADAAGAFNAALLQRVRTRFPDQWMELAPNVVTVATWVGYDLDGRTDIHWGQSLRLRLEEKTEQLGRYRAAVARCLEDMVSGEGARDTVAALGRRLADAEASASEDAAAFDGDLSNPDVAAHAANTLTRADPRRLVSIAEVRASLDAAVAEATQDDTRDALWLLRAQVAAFGLGAALIHQRINAAQLLNAVRADLDLPADAATLGRRARDRAARAIAETETRRINFASVFLEQTTARRQMMLASQILKHVDADAPIRFLIAECEDAVPVLAAVYLAKLYGCDRHIDVSPLFETSEALERGGRLMEQLLDTGEYQTYAKARGRVTVQIGYSDSGRFMGQVAAGLASERLQILIARAMEAQELAGLDAVIFNTHGESMGRGAHPDSLDQRIDYLMTPWTRSRFARADIGVVHETSFQGGDGYLHFATPELARATFAGVARAAFAPNPGDARDPFYADINFSWDFFQAVKGWQATLYENPDYRAALGPFGRNLLVTTGSRKSKRQSEGEAAQGPRSLRAIPHNAILQSLGAPINVAGGVGAAASHEFDRFIDWLAASPRAHTALRMAAAARRRSSLPALRAYAAVFEPAMWTARAYVRAEPAVAAPAALLAERLRSMRRTGSLARLANLAAADFAHLDRVLTAAPELDDPDPTWARQTLHALHGVRAALAMRVALLAARLPDFSPRKDVRKADLIDLALDMRIEEVLAFLDELFPEARPEAALLEAVEEEADDVAANAGGYPEVQASIVRPIRETYDSMRTIGVVLGHIYGAYG